MKTTIDKNGKTVVLGERVKVVGVPELPEWMQEESLPVFKKAVGGTYQVYEIDEYGNIWIEVDGVIPKEHSIALEPEYVELVST